MSNPLRVEMSGPLSAFATGFLEDLIQRGYRPGSAAKQLQLMAHLSRWLEAHHLEPGALHRVEIERFVRERRASHLQLASTRALEPVLGYLRGLGVVPPRGSQEAPTPAGALLDRYAEYLLQQRGLKPSTVRNYCNHVRAFLADRERVAGDPGLGALDMAAINDYVLRESQRLSVSSTQALALALRSVLRFLHLEGLLDSDLATAVPSVAKCRLVSLVKAVDASFVARLLESCDRRTAVGRRDFAILTLLSRLGLRINEVAALRLEDLDWRAGELLISGKGGRQERLPLPTDIGEAIVGWLRYGRPTMACIPRRSTALWVGRAGVPGCRRSRLIGCGTRPRPRCCAPARACARSGRCCAIAAARSPRSTPRSTAARSPRSSSRGRGAAA